jgi:hypothetical protein
MKNKVMTILKTELEKKGNVNAAQLQKIENMLKKAGEATIDDEIIGFLNSRIPNALTMSYIAKEINRKEGAYARWGNYFVIQGYLGEVYWNACVNYLFGSENVAKALGNQKNISGKSLSVDMFARGAGFQIKTWHLKEVEGMGLTHNSSTEMYFGNFL